MISNCDRVMGQAVTLRSLTAQARVRSRTNSCGICGGKSGFGTDFSPSTWILPRHCHSVHPLSTFIHLQPTLCVSINPLNTELNPICHLLALLGAHHILHVSRIRVKRHCRHAKKLQIVTISFWIGLVCLSSSIWTEMKASMKF